MDEKLEAFLEVLFKFKSKLSCLYPNQFEKYLKIHILLVVDV